MNKESAYDQLMKGIARDAEMMKVPAETPQHILYLKAVGVARLENLDKDQYYTVSSNGLFGISEPAVNMLMTMAYLKGSRDIEQRSYDHGWEDAMKKVRTVVDEE